MLSEGYFSRRRANTFWYKAFQISFFVFILLGTVSTPAQAEFVKTPLYLLLKPGVSSENAPEDGYRAYLNTGDLWKWNGDDKGKLIQVTHWGFNAVPVLSPNGNDVAYQSMPQVAVDYLSSEASHVAGMVTSALPFNLWILNTQTDEAKRITEQSQSTHLDLVNADLVNGITRSVPAWSADSHNLVWIEADSSAAMSGGDDDKFVPRLMSYDLATEQTEIMSNYLILPDYASPQGGGTAIGDMVPQWGTAGIVIGYYGPDNQEIYAIYDLAGKLQQELKSERHTFFPVYGWVNDGQQDYLGLRDMSGWSFYDTKTGKNKLFDGQIEGYSLLTPKGNALRVNENGNWVLVDSKNHTQELTDCRFDEYPLSGIIALSPNGERAACYQSAENLVSIYTEAGLLTQLLLDKNTLLGMSWASMGWRIVRSTS